MEWARRTTSRECYAVISAAHPDLVPMSSFTDVTGAFSGGSRGCIETEWGFGGAPVPLIGSSARWDIRGGSDKRFNEERRYWLCVPVEVRPAARGGE